MVNGLLLAGISIYLGNLSGKIAKKSRIPQVVGYIILGLVLGQTGFNLISQDMISSLTNINYFALGLIGFSIGSELKKDVLVKYGRQFITILLFEGLTTFIIVSLFSFIIGLLVFDNTPQTLALSLLLGSIASATAPAATTDVLWEYKTRGPLTRTILGIVAMDDALALFLFSIAASAASIIIGDGSGGFKEIVHPFVEIFGSVTLGIVFGLLLSFSIRRILEEEKILSVSIGVILFGLGLSLFLKQDMLMVAMAMGFALVNHAPNKSKLVLSLVSKFSPPIYVLFFVLVGAKLQLNNITLPIFFMGLAYLIGRTTGKMLGSNLGARISNSPKTVQKYLPLCLFSQAGVAIGLSIFASNRFEGMIGDSIVAIITATTFVVQLIGPYATKVAVTKAGEVGLNLSERDLIMKSTLSEILNVKKNTLQEATPVNGILTLFSQNSDNYYSVKDHDGQLKGIIGIETIKQTFMTTEINHFLLAIDIMEDIKKTVSSDLAISDAKDFFDRDHLEYLAIIDENGKESGVIESRDIDKLMRLKLMELHKQAESLD